MRDLGQSLRTRYPRKWIPVCGHTLPHVLFVCVCVSVRWNRTPTTSEEQVCDAVILAFAPQGVLECKDTWYLAWRAWGREKLKLSISRFCLQQIRISDGPRSLSSLTHDSSIYDVPFTRHDLPNPPFYSIAIRHTDDLMNIYFWFF